MSIFDGFLTLSLDDAWQIHHGQVEHYSQLLDTDSQRAAFQAAVERLNAGRSIESGWDVPRGVEIERLYFRAKSRTDAEHAAFCASLD